MVFLLYRGFWHPCLNGAMLGLGRGSLRCRDGVRCGRGIYLSNKCAAEAGSVACCVCRRYMGWLRRGVARRAAEATARAMPAAQHQRPDLPQKILFTATPITNYKKWISGQAPRRREVYKWNLIK